jgi:hypothetical protein
MRAVSRRSLPGSVPSRLSETHSTNVFNCQTCDERPSRNRQSIGLSSWGATRILPCPARIVAFAKKCRATLTAGVLVRSVFEVRPSAVRAELKGGQLLDEQEIQDIEDPSEMGAQRNPASGSNVTLRWGLCRQNGARQFSNTRRHPVSPQHRLRRILIFTNVLKRISTKRPGILDIKRLSELVLKFGKDVCMANSTIR